MFDRGQLDERQAGMLAVIVSASGAAAALPREELAVAVAAQLASEFGRAELAAPAWSGVVTEKRATYASTPGLAGSTGVKKRIVLKGELPSPLNPPTGCVFSTRCPHVTERCRAERPKLREVAQRQVACHYAENFLIA